MTEDLVEATLNRLIDASGPWSIAEARVACRQASVLQKGAEDAVRAAAREFAEAEEAYRKALAGEILRAHNDGVAWTAAADLARGDDHVAELRRKRDIAEGVREALEQAVWRRVADRKDAQRFSEWSQRRELAEAYGQTPEPEGEQPIGGR